MTFKELKETLAADYDRLIPLRGGVIRRYLFHPPFNWLVWFRFLSYLKTKGFIGKLLIGLFFYHYKWKSAKLGIDMLIGTKIGKGFQIGHHGLNVVNSMAVIGENCSMMQDVTVGGWKEHAPHIGNNVTLFAGARVFGDVRIGNNVVVGANAVVTHDVPDNAVVAGIPAKVISMKGYEYTKVPHRG